MKKQDAIKQIEKALKELDSVDGISEKIDEVIDNAYSELYGAKLDIEDDDLEKFFKVKISWKDSNGNVSVDDRTFKGMNYEEAEDKGKEFVEHHGWELINSEVQ